MSKVPGIAVAAGVFVTLILAVISLATADWIHYENIKISSGLWQSCISGECSNYEANSDYLKATQAFHILGLIALLASFCLAIMGAIGKGGIFMKLTAASLIVSMVFYVIAMSVFTANTTLPRGLVYGYSYILGWVTFSLCFLLSIVAGAVASREK